MPFVHADMPCTWVMKNAIRSMIFDPMVSSLKRQTPSAASITARETMPMRRAS